MDCIHDMVRRDEHKTKNSNEKVEDFNDEHSLI